MGIIVAPDCLKTYDIGDSHPSPSVLESLHVSISGRLEKHRGFLSMTCVLPGAASTGLAVPRKIFADS